MGYLIEFYAIIILKHKFKMTECRLLVILQKLLKKDILLFNSYL